MLIRPANISDINHLVNIYNQGIRTGLSTFETAERSEEDVLTWFSQTEKYPLLVIETDNQVAGWARLYQYRPRGCYDPIAEYSVYLAEQAKGKGYGKKLLQELIIQAKQAGFHKLVSRIFSNNHASLALCKATGFRQVGVYEKHGKINDQWLDVVIVELIL